MNSRILFSILASVALSACGLASHGGIVDNGNKPADPSPGPNPTSTPTPEKVTPVPVMTKYQVDVPSKWPVDATLESNILKVNGQAIFFAEGTGVCAVEPTVSEFDVKVYACTPTMTIFDVGYGDFIIAKHPKRNAEIDRVLFSLRRT